MFSKNNTKMNSRRECEKYNQYGIKKFNAGAASVLIASGFFFLGGAAQAADLASKQESNVENVAGNDKASSDSVKKSEEALVAATNATAQDNTSKQEVPKSEQAEVKVEKAVVNKAKLQEKINKLNDLFVTLAGRDLSETQQKLTVDAAKELNKAKDLIVAENATQAQVDAQTVAVENSISFLNKSLEATKAEDKKTEEKKADKKSDKEVAKENLEKAISEAKVVNQAANTFAAKSVKEEAQKAEIKAAVETAEKTIAKALDIFNSDSSTKQDSEKERKELERAIEAVYATMKRAGHKGELKGLLDGTTGTTTGARDLAPKVLTPVTNPESLTDSEIAAIEKEIRTSNPGLTNEDTITVQKTRGVQGAGFTTITYADGSGSVTFEPGQVMVASAGIKNLEQLSSSINWFNFASATITYKDGTVASPVRYYGDSTTTPGGRLYKQLDESTGSTGRTFEGYFSMYRDVVLGRDYTVDGVLYTKGTRLKSTDDAFLKMGIAKYEQHIYYSGNLQGQTDVKIPNAGTNPTTYTTKSLGEIYEVLQLGMKFDVPTRVEGYKLSATVSKLAPKEVEKDPQKGQGNRLRYYTSGDKGNSKAYGPTRVYDIVDAQNGGGRDVDVLLTTQDKTNSYLRTAGIHTNYRERREGDSDTNPTGPIREGLVAFSSSRDHANFGVSLYLEATYNGQLVPVNAVVADADESGRREYSQFETDGGDWEKLMEIHWDNRRLDSKGDAIVDGNGTSVLVDKNGNPYVDATGNPMFINNKQTPTRENVVENGITEAKYYLTTASGAKVLVSEKDHMPVLDADGNPTILDSTGTRMTTTKEGLFRSTEVDRNGIKIKTREILDAEGRPILQGSAAMKGLEAFILPSGVKTFEIEYIGNPANHKRRYFDTTDGKHEEIKKDFYGRSIMYGSEVDGRLAKEGGDDRATLKFKNPDKRPVQLANAGDLGDMKDAGYEPKQWVSPSAYGSKTFGSFWDAREDGYRLPIGLTQGVSNLSFYGNSTSSVSGVVGFIVTDGGDAPKSYGSAKHVIGNFNKVINNQEVTATQPYLGDQPGDPDFRSTVNEKSGDWVLDDLVMTNKYIETNLGAGETDPTKQVQVTNQKGDTGKFIITVNGNAVIRKEDGSQVAINQGDVLTTPDPKTGLPLVGIYNSTTQKLGVGAIPDEGEAQLLDPDAVDGTGKKIKGEYTLRQASDTEYVLYGVKANPGVNNKEAYLYGWVDFNGNGQFDKDERSELIKVTPGQKTYDVKFKNIAQLLDTSIDKTGVRLRIALEEQDIRESTGLAGSGEVEDFQTFVTHFPRGTRHETKDYQGQEQTIKVPTNAMFIANGKSKDSGYKNWAQINNVELSPKIVLTDKIVNPNTVTTLDPNAEKDKTDLGTKGIISSLRKNSDGSIYTNAEGKVFIDKKDSTVLSGKLVQVKDKNNKVLGTALEVVNPNNNKTEYLMSEYIEYDSVGNKVGTYKINPATAGGNKEVTGGFYETTVTFKPEIGYVGRAKGIAIRAWDDNNNSTGWEASTQTIAASAASTTLADKDKISGNVNNGVNNYKSMDTVYVPTVIDIKPVGKDETTIDEQGKKQSATPRIPDHGTVESINNEHIDEAKIDKAHVLIDKTKPITFSEVKNIPGKLYEVDTPVDKETTLTYEDGGTETFKPADKVPAGTEIAKHGAITITGSGGVTVSGVRIGEEGTTNSPRKVPAGSVLEGALPTAPSPVTVLRNGVEVTVNTGEKLQVGDQLVTPLPIVNGAQITTWKVTLQKGDVIPKSYSTLKPRLVDETSVDKLIGNKGDSVTVDNTSYVNYNNIIPKGTRTVGKTVPLTNLTLPKATHVNPTTGEVTTVERRYTKIDIENGIIEIENEGTYKLVPKKTTNEKGETVYEDATVVFTPHPSFVGVGTGVTIKQPDVDYDNPDENDSVRRRYGTDYGYATYTPTVTPNLTATITRKIHYVYEGDASTAPKDKTPILTIDGKPVTNEQTLTYNRDYIVMSQDGQTEKDITVATEMTLESPITVDRYVRKATGEVVKEVTQVTQLKPGDVVKAGTQLPAGTVIVGAWKSINPENDYFTNIISPTLKGYTAEVQLPETEYTKSEKNGVQSHVRSSNQTPVGVYTPTIKDGKVNTQDIGAYEPMVSAVRADNKDDFDVYVYYKADKQVARVVYIDMDAASNADQGVLETHTGSTLEANKSATDTLTKDETLYGDSATRIKYSTAATIAKYEAMGYELKRDGFTNDDDGNRIVGGRKFDEESVADSENAGEKAQNQTFYVFLGHKRDTGAKTERADVTRRINYKYKKDGSKAAESVTETLNFTRNITIDMALAAAAFPEDTATFNAENTKATPEEKQAAQAKYAEVEKQYNAAAEKVKEDATTAQALVTADKDVTTTEKALADAKKANNSLVITSGSTQAQKDAKAAAEAALQAAQTAYDNALAARNTARTNYLAAANSDLAKAVVTTQQALEAENAKVAAAKAEYEAKVKDNSATDADKNAALTKFTDALAVAKTAAANATAAQKAFTDAKDEKEALNDSKIAEAVKNKAIQDRANTTQAAKEAARQAYYDAIIAKVKEESKKETPDKNKVAAVSFGEWKALGSTATNLPANEQLSEAEKQSDNAFNNVTSPTITGYLADKVAIDKTDAIDPLADDYEVDVFYEQGEQRATVKFVEVDANNPDTVITPGVAEDLVEIGKTGDNFATLNTAAVKAAIKKLEDKGYTLVSDGFENPGTGVSNTTFDNDPKKDQEFVVKVKAKVVDIPSFDPTKPTSNDNPKPTPGVTPIDPSNPSGPKWTEDLIKAVNVQEEVTRTIKYVYEDGTEVPADKLADVADKKVKTVKFTRPGKINVVTGEITYGDWSADQTFETVTSPTIENYTAVVAGLTPATDTVPTKTVAATDKDFEEVVVYKTKSITVDPNPVDPNEDPDPNKVVENDPKKRTLKELGLVEEVKHTIHYVYEDGTKADEDVVQTLTYTRTAKIDPVTGAVSDYSTWTPKKGDDFTAVTSPAKEGYIVSKATSIAINDVPATADDTEETIIYRKLGSYIPVVPEGVTVPPGTDTTAKVYPKNPNDPTKPGTPTTTIPEIPGTTPVGPNGTPLTKNPNGGYDLPPVPEDPTQNTTITYVKDGSQVAVVHFVDEKGNSVNESVVETGDTGGTISTTKVDAVKSTLEGKGYEVVALTDALYTADKEAFYKEADRKFDAVSDKATGAANEKVPSQQYYVIVKAKDLPVDPTKPLDPNNNPVDPTNPTPENPTKPRDPNTSVTPKPEDKVPNDPKGRTYGELGLVEQVTRTINYVKNDGSKAAEPVKETLTFTRKAKINAVTGEVTYLDNDGNATTKEAAPWTPVNNDTTFDKVTSPSVPDYTPTVAEVPAKENVTATDEDIVETVVYNPTKQTVDPNAPKDPSTPNVTPKPNDVVPNDPQGRTYKELGLIEEVTRTVHYVYEDGTKAVEDKVQTITFTRTAEIDTVTGAISNFGTWTLKDENNTFEPETTEAKDGYIASAAKSTEVTGVQATDKDTEETIIYRKLGSYVPVVPAGVTPPADFDKTPKPYPNATPEDPTRPGTPTTPTTTIPEIPGTTPVGPDGTPLTKNPNGGYDLPPVPTDPTQNTTITYVKDGSQVAVVHFVDEKGNSVNESVVETGDTGKEISKTNVDKVKAALEAKGYTVVEPTDALYTTDKEGFYKEATRTFDAVSDKSTGAANEKVPSQQYYVIVKAKEIPADPTKPGTDTPANPTPENPTPGTNTPAKPGDKIPGDPLKRTYGDLGLVEQVTRTINYVKNDGSKAAEPVKETLTFTRKAKINAVTGEVTYLDNDGNATTKEAAPWTPVNNDTTFDKVTSPSVPDYTPTVAEVPAKENVTATDEDIVETVVYNPTKVTVTPNDPNVDPEKPLNPNDPNGLKYKDLKLTEEVVRTITYTYADDVADTTKRGTDAAPKHETTVSFTRTATVNQATGEVTYGDWTPVNNDTTLEGRTELPVIPGYVATGDVESAKKDVANVTATDKDIVEKVVYKDLGKYVPVVPEGTTPPTITDPKYPNNPTDPTKPGEPTTTIPNVPGLTPLDPSTGKPLEPKDPNDLTKGYKPPVPQDPSKDTNIVYVADGSQVTVVHFVDEDGKAVHTSFVEAGDAGSKFTKAGEVTKVVDELKAAGYVVVPNKAGQAEYPGEAGVFDSVDDKGKDGVSQVYYVTVAKTIPVTPTTPQNPNEEPKNPNPGDPIDPKNPNGPKWTKEALDKLNNIKSVTRTITYVKDGTDEEVSTTEAPKVTNKVSFTRTVIVNPKDGSVVGYDTNGDGVADVPATDTTSGWAAAGTAKFAEVKSPVVKGYVVKPDQDTQGDLVEADGSKVKASATDLTVDSANQDLKVRYVPVGTWTPKVPEGETPIDPIPYPNDPTDPGKVVDPNKPTDPNDPNKPSVPVVPHIPGTTPKDPNGNPLKPVDPEDPTKGYVPPTPTTPTENTVIEYVKDDQKAVTKFVDPSGNPIPGVNNIEEKGKSGEPLTKATEVTTEIAKLIAKGYDLVSNNYGKDNNGNFDKDSGKDQEYTVVLTPHVEPIKPFDPTNPNDPNTPKPGQPIDPNNPDGPKWTEELIKSLETTKHVNRTISYVDKDGNKVEYTDKDGNKSTADVTDKVTFTREAKINVVTGTIEYGKWTPVNKDTTFEKVTSPVVPGYVLKDPAQKEVAETTGLTENSEDENIKVVYVKVGSIVPKIPDGETPSTPATPTPYNNVPNEPGKVVTPDPTKPTDPQDPNSPKVPVIPHVPGRTPQVPKDPNKPFDPDTNPLVPLTPVDPKDPTKGYEVPPVPTDPTKNIEIEYVKDEQNAVTKFVDPQGNAIPGFDKITETGKSGEPLTKANEIATKIAELQKLGYVVVSNNYGKDNNGNFDKDKSVDQEYTVVVKPVIVPVNPQPGQPIDPENPNGPKWDENLIKQLDTKREVKRTITYVDEFGNTVSKQVDDKVTFTRDAKINTVTREITYGDWKASNDDTTFDKVTSPSLKGYVLKDASQKEVAATTGLTPDSKDENIVVVYKKLGSWIPKVPEGETPIDPIPYPNDPTDPTKPGTDKPRIPEIPGHTPLVPTDPTKPVSPTNPLKPLDPSPQGGYEVPNVPTDPSKDTPIEYVKDGQRAITNFVDKDGNVVAPSVIDSGKSNTSFTKDKDVAATVAKLISQGYDVVSNDYPTNGKFDNDDKVDQYFNVVVTPHVEPVKPFDPENPQDPNRPQPNQPIDPNNPEGPKWTEELINKLETTKHVNRTIIYINENGDTVAKKVTDKVTFTREAKVNTVTKEITYGEWKAVNNDTTFDAVDSPVVPGYVLKDAAQKQVAATTGLTSDSKDENITVVYTKLGSWVPKVPEGETPIDPIPYPNDPKDPTKPGTPTPTPVVPYVPGTTPQVPTDPTKPVGPNNPLVPLKPVDPQDPTKGYEVPPVPTKPGTDTPIVYVKDGQKAIVNFVDENGNTVAASILETGKSGASFTKGSSVTSTIAELVVKGYEVVSNDYPTNGKFDNDDNVDQVYTVVVKPVTKPIVTPEPGKPINPDNPEGPKFGEEEISTEKVVTRTVKYVDEKGTVIYTTHKEKLKFTRTASVNSVTKKVTYGDWVAVNGDDTLDAVTSPVIKGYVLKAGQPKVVAERAGLNGDSPSDEFTVVYTKLGSWVPKVPEGATPIKPTPYPNDPTDPTKPGTDKPIVPQVPGTTPQVPQDPTKPVGPNNPLVPLKPVDPKDPSKGYEVPPVPTNPGTDTPIYYVTDKQKAITNFVDNNGKVVSTPVVDEGDSGAKFTKGGEVESKIKELVKKGYVVTSNEYPSDDKDRVFDKDKDKDQIFNVTLTPLIVPTDPNSPDKPQVPTDPTKPVGPNNPLKPATPSTPEPGKPVFPEDPNSPVWPDTVKDLVTESSATRTITYVDQNGKEVAATHTETIKFKRSAKVNLVTGEITYGEWTVVGDDTILDGNKLPKVDGYIARGGDIKESQEDIKATVGANITQTVVYDKLGSWVPKVPEGATPVPPITYPNDPTDPTKPGTDKPHVPYVPGFIPVGPDGTPLKPVDPTDPSKGYEVPGVPADPTKDTPISYVPVNPETPVTPAVPKAPAKAGRLANTGTTETNTGLAGLGMAIFGGLLAAAKRRKEKK